ncbi:hypothetical protein BN77_p11267 [Rhizobium mesoamericanum STM3625]|uniref:Uncharacterized protein n=1 Tax=Rhizobium mesoamericanum STM3625 TaxID=1211777 RepID=K0Q2X4_9HYPH|nr:hypothetical protein BN77_p11267 [Rhizobium mesoamericanum STM3625]
MSHARRSSSGTDAAMPCRTSTFSKGSRRMGQESRPDDEELYVAMDGVRDKKQLIFETAFPTPPACFGCP